MSLPPPANNQAYCDVSALESGHIDLPLQMFVEGGDPDGISRLPVLSFLILHSQTANKFVFDLGIRRDWENYPPTVVSWIKDESTIRVPQDVVESLAKGGLLPSDITSVCLSHCHFDHVGDTKPFTSSQFFVGEESATLLDPGYPKDPDARFASDLLPRERTTFLSAKEWGPLGPFPHALDFYGDGSLYIVDAPGHLPGHINVLARTSPDGGWIYLAGDSAHLWELLTGEAKIAVGYPRYPTGCAHNDKSTAEAHILRIRMLLEMPKVRVLLAHDEPWYKVNKEGAAFWPGKIESL